MDGRPGSPSQLPASNIKYHHPYFSPGEVEYLTEKLRGKMPINQEKLRQQACAFIEGVSIRSGWGGLFRSLNFARLRLTFGFSAPEKR